MLLDPVPLWSDVRQRLARSDALFWLLTAAAAGGLVIALATEIGVRVFNTDWNYVAGYAVQSGRDWRPFALLWLCASLSALLQGIFAAFLLPMYGRPRRWLAGLAVGVVGSMPLYAAGATLVVLPGILVVGVAFLVSCAWWGSGARELLGVPLGESADHVAASLVASATVLFIVAAMVPL